MIATPTRIIKRPVSRVAHDAHISEHAEIIFFIVKKLYHIQILLVLADTDVFRLTTENLFKWPT